MFIEIKKAAQYENDRIQNTFFIILSFSYTYKVSKASLQKSFGYRLNPKTWHGLTQFKNFDVKCKKLH